MSTVALGETVPSLMPGSASMYQIAQFRATTSGRLRVQGAHVTGEPASAGKAWEADTIKVTPELLAWVNALEHTRPSIAGTGTKYAECRIRHDGTGTRFQVAGPKLNREWGAEFALPGWNAPGLLAAPTLDVEAETPEADPGEDDEDEA